MKKLIYIILLISISCSSQKNKQMVKKIDLSSYQEMNYIFARIHNSKPISKEFYKGSLYATIFHLSDSKATPDSLFEGYDGMVSSYIISITPDGDYYSWSKLYKIEGLINPKILEIEETEYPNFGIKIEEGFFNNRKVINFKLVGK